MRIITSERYSGRRTALANTIWGRLYQKCYVHPTRFYGDLQYTGITNWHQKVQSFVESFPKEAVLLDIGSGSRRIAKNILAMDVKFNSSINFLGDAHFIPVKTECIDGAIIQMVLEHVPNPGSVLSEVHRILKPGGRIYCEVPFLFPVHDRVDYHRWTLSGLINLCTLFQQLGAGTCMGPFSALSALLRRHITLFASTLFMEAIVDLVSGWVLLPLKYLDEWIPSLRDTEIVAGGVYFLGKKGF